MSTAPREHYIALCLAAEKRGLIVELTVGERRPSHNGDRGRHLEAVRVVRPAGNGKLCEARIGAGGIDAAAQDCLAILTRERRTG